MIDRLAVTGHRANKLLGYGWKGRCDLSLFALEMLKKHPCKELISGMAIGWDQAAAEAALVLDIPLTAAIPFLGQQNIWPKEIRDYYDELVERATTVKILHPGGYTREKLLKRNLWMVENSDALLALWDGSEGGTGHCVSCCLTSPNRNYQLINVWGAFEKQFRLSV